MTDILSYALTWTLVHSLWIGLALMLLVKASMLIKTASIRLWTKLMLVLVYCLVVFELFTLLANSGQRDFVSTFTSTGVSNLADLGGSDLLFLTLIDYVNSLGPWLNAIWITGLLFNVFKIAVHRMHISKIYQTSISFFDEALVNRFMLLKGRLKVNQKVELRFSPLVSSPFTVGLIKPIIYWPISATIGFTCSELDSILYHELLHIKRKDYLINILLHIVDSLFFFNPIMLYITKDIRNDMEYSNDEKVVQNLDKVDYMKALIKLQELNIDQRFNLAAKGNGSEFRIRISYILNQGNMKNNFSRIVPLISMIAILCIAALISSFDTRAIDVVRFETYSEQPTAFAQDTLKLLNKEDSREDDKNSEGSEKKEPQHNIRSEEVIEIRDVNNSRMRGEQMMREIEKELLQDEILTSNNPKVRLMFQYSDLLNGKEELGNKYDKYKQIFNRYFPVYDSYATTRVFRFKEGD